MATPLKVVAAIIVKNNRVLCTQRNRKATMGMKWEFPGGKIEPNESPEEALKREIKEELDCIITVKEWVATSLHSYDFGTIELTGYLCELDDEHILLNEHEAMKWLTPTDLNTLDWADADLPLVRGIQDVLSSDI